MARFSKETTGLTVANAVTTDITAILRATTGLADDEIFAITSFNFYCDVEVTLELNGGEVLTKIPIGGTEFIYTLDMSDGVRVNPIKVSNASGGVATWKIPSFTY